MLEQLRTRGIVLAGDAFEAERIAVWNSLLDEVLSGPDAGDRTYVSAWQLHQAGILRQILTPAIRWAIRSMSINAVIYHCHACEIAANRSVSHIHAGPLAGWHADDECAPFYRLHHLGFVSMFVYLTEVAGPVSGPFEIRPAVPTIPLRHGQPSVQILGPTGTTFFFHRSFFHRAAPNRGDRRRRVFKLSFQDRGRPHGRRHLEEFRRVSESTRDSDPFVSQLFDTARVDVDWVPPDVAHADLPEVDVPRPNSRVDLPLSGRVKTLLGGGRLAT